LKITFTWLHREDPGTDASQERQITGVFAADRPESLLPFLERDEALEIERWDGGLVIRGR
jgi:hypothetical protein